MPQVLRMHEQMNFFIYRNCHLGGHDVIFRIRIVGGVQAKKVLVGFADLVGMQGAEFSIWTGIAEVKSELPSLNLDRHGVSCWRSEILISPRLDSENSQS